MVVDTLSGNNEFPPGSLKTCAHPDIRSHPNRRHSIEEIQKNDEEADTASRERCKKTYNSNSRARYLFAIHLHGTARKHYEVS